MHTSRVTCIEEAVGVLDKLLGMRPRLAHVLSEGRDGLDGLGLSDLHSIGSQKTPSHATKINVTETAVQGILRHTYSRPALTS